MPTGLRNRRAGHLRAISHPGEPLEHSVHELRFRIRRRYSKDPEEAADLVGSPVMSQPEPHTTAAEQPAAAAAALLAPLTRKQLAIHQVGADVIVLNEPMEGVEGRM